MLRLGSRKLTVALLIGGIIAVGVAVYLLVKTDGPPPSLRDTVSTSTTTPTSTAPTSQTIGASVEGRDITAYTYGDGSTHLLFVGGIHGGYEHNSVLLSYRLMDWLEANPELLPDELKVSVIPNLNPDGLYDVIGQTGRFSQADVPADAGSGGAGRFNANAVDLNRNFACNWAPTSTWRGQEVSAGTSAFSEPEAQALRSFVQANDLTAGVFFHSAAGAVYGATCDGSVGAGTITLMNTYAQAAGYRAVEQFTAYPITGDVEGWLTTLGVPAVSVELTNHTDVEWEKNRAGIQALFDHYTTE